MIHHALSLFLHARFLAPMLSLRSFSQFDPRPLSSLPSLERRTPPCCRERSPRPCRYLLRWDIMSSDFLESSSDSKRNKPEPSSQTLQDVVRWIEKRILTCPPDSFSAPQRLPSSPRSLVNLNLFKDYPLPSMTTRCSQNFWPWFWLRIGGITVRMRFQSPVSPPMKSPPYPRSRKFY